MTFPQGTAALAISIALGEQGVIEEPENITKYGKFMKADGLPWCGSFCNWVLAQAGVKNHSVVGTAAGAHKFKEMARWFNEPIRGDLAFMDFPHDGVDRISHVGIVVGRDGNNILIVEGNTSRGGDQRNGGMVLLKVRTADVIVGYGRPKYVPYKGEYPLVEVAPPPKKAKLLKGKK